ncbi:MAG: hypothetical protein DME84_04915 [Verrucomicrobia bacterium]|nr:MAG: hypothetical protein DME84_04915 [Verrucomicrobiota bacterium]
MFYTHRTAHGTTAEERAAYESGEKAGEKAPADAKLPAEAELNMIAQKYFEQQGQLNSSKILRDQPTCRLLNRLSQRVTRTGSRKRIPTSERKQNHRGHEERRDHPRGPKS